MTDKQMITDGVNVSECLVLEHELKQAEEKLKRIREFATALCYTVMSDGVVILQKDILKIIDEVENEI